MYEKSLSSSREPTGWWNRPTWNNRGNVATAEEPMELVLLCNCDRDELCSKSQSDLSSQLRATKRNKLRFQSVGDRLRCSPCPSPKIRTRCGCAVRWRNRAGYGAQWPVCRSWCQCHPFSQFSLGACCLDPGVPGKSPRYPPDAAPTSGSSGATSANLTVAFARIAAISSPLMNAVARADESRNRRPGEVPRNRLRRDLDSPAAAVTFFRAAAAENSGTFDPSNLPRADESEKVSANLFRVTSHFLSN